jgi:hypothetical protein
MRSLILILFDWTCRCGYTNPNSYSKCRSCGEPG